MAPLRCSLRMGLKGWYSPEQKRVNVPVWEQSFESDRLLTIFHELVHRDLTEKTICGQFDILLARAADDQNTTETTRHAISQTYGRFFDAAFNIHEGTATYCSAIQLALVRLGQPVTNLSSKSTALDNPWAQLPADYERALQMVLRVFPRYDAISASSLPLIGPLSIALARWALDWLQYDEILMAAPRTWNDLESLLVVKAADAVFEEAVRKISDEGGLPSLQRAVCHNLNIANWRELEAKAQAIMFSKGVKVLEESDLTRDLEDFMNSLEEALRNALGQHNAYRSLEDKHLVAPPEVGWRPGCQPCV